MGESGIDCPYALEAARNFMQSFVLNILFIICFSEDL